MKQLFFRADEVAGARAAALKYDVELFAIYDRRSRKPRDRMLVLTEAALLQLKGSKLWKRMWVAVRLKEWGDEG